MLVYIWPCFVGRISILTPIADTLRSQFTEELGRAVEEMGFTYIAEWRGRQYGASIVTAVLMEVDNDSLPKEARKPPSWIAGVQRPLSIDRHLF